MSARDVSRSKDVMAEKARLFLEQFIEVEGEWIRDWLSKEHGETFGADMALLTLEKYRWDDGYHFDKRGNSVPGIEADCGGALSCGTCHVYVADDWVSRLPSMEDMEKDMLDFAWEPDSDTSRLSCQIKLSDSLNGLIVQIPANQG